MSCARSRTCRRASGGSSSSTAGASAASTSAGASTPSTTAARTRAARCAAGPITGTVLEGRGFEYGREGEIVRCALHGWEFEIATGRALADPRMRARTYDVTVEDGRVVVTL